MQSEGIVRVKGEGIKPFKMKIHHVGYEKGDILLYSVSRSYLVVKVYKFNLWRKLLCKLGIEFKYMDLELVTNGK